MLHKLANFFTIGVIFLASCISRLPMSVTSPLLPTSTFFTTTTPSFITAITPPIKITPTPLPPTATKTPTQPIKDVLKKDCLEVLPEIPSGAEVDGMIILDSRVDIDGRSSFDIFLLNIAKRTMTQLAKPNENLIYFAVSPDRQWVAYSRSLFDKPGGKSLERQLVIATAEDTHQKAVQWEKGWGQIAGWLDNQNLVINIAGLDPDESTALKAASLMVLNPFTGERRVLHPDFPDIYNMPRVPDWDGWGETMYDPALTRVVYPRWIDSGTYEYTLGDLQGEEVLNTFLFTFFPMPRWSPDGLRFVVAGYLVPQGYGLYSIDRDGKNIIPLTQTN